MALLQSIVIVCFSIYLGQVVRENPFENRISHEKLLEAPREQLHNVRDVKNCLRFTLKFFFSLIIRRSAFGVLHILNGSVGLGRRVKGA